MNSPMIETERKPCTQRLVQRCAAMALVALAALPSGPAAAQAAGIAVYPGAKQHAPTTEFLRTQMGVEGVAYRTNDSLQKVAAFYQQQPGMKPMGDATKDSAAFVAGCKEEYNAVMKKKMSAGCTHHVTVQNPWMDMKTGKMVADTLVSVVKQ